MYLNSNIKLLIYKLNIFKEYKIYFKLLYLFSKNIHNFLTLTILKIQRLIIQILPMNLLQCVWVFRIHLFLVLYYHQVFYLLIQ